MLIIYIHRWPFQPPKIDDNELPNAVNFFLDEGVQQQRPWLHTSTSQPLWFNATDELPGRLEDDSTWQSLLPWKESQLRLWDFDENFVPQVTNRLDEEYWYTFLRWVDSCNKLTLWDDNDLVSGAYFLLDEEYWLQLSPWSVSSYVTIWLTDDAHVVPASNPLDEDYWLVLLKQQSLYNTYIPQDDNDLVSGAYFLLSEEYWLRLDPHTLYNYTTLYHTNDEIPFVIVDDAEFIRLFVWPLFTSRYIWYDEDSLPLSLAIDDTEWIQSPVWNEQTYTPLWHAEDEYPTPATPFFLDEFFFHSSAPWSMVYPGWRQWSLPWTITGEPDIGTPSADPHEFRFYLHIRE